MQHEYILSTSKARELFQCTGRLFLFSWTHLITPLVALPWVLRCSRSRPEVHPRRTCISNLFSYILQGDRAKDLFPGADIGTPQKVCLRSERRRLSLNDIKWPPRDVMHAVDKRH